MYKVRINPQWVLQRPGELPQPLPGLLRLCASINELGNLAAACRHIGVSYRHGWGLLQEATRMFQSPVADLERGRGATLTALGEKLLWADKRISARLSPILDTLASELEVELERVLSHTTGILRMHASHGFAVEALRETLIEHAIPVELKYVGSQEALASLGQHECDIAGFHVPIGSLQAAALKQYASWLRAPGLKLINLATRQQGLMLPAKNPKRLSALSDLCREDIRFINRQPGSGTRLLLDLLLKRDGIDSRGVHGYEVSEYTHAAVAAHVASGMADVGFGIETGARRFGLDFIPVVTERYFLACENERLKLKSIEQLLAILQSGTFAARVNQLPGYNAKDCGKVMSITEAFKTATTSPPSKTRRTGSKP
jgi:molybdate transport repressor ModE-like protein